MVYKLCFILLVVCSSCSSKESAIQEYLALLHDEDNGYNKSIEVGDLQLEMKLIPAEYMAYMESKGDGKFGSQSKMDSLIKTYENNLHFILTMGPTEETKDKFDVTTIGVANYDEFDERAKTLNFQMKERLTLSNGERKWTAVICEMENVYSLSFHRTFNIVFTPQKSISELKNLKSFRLTYDDEIFGVGKNTFAFNELKQKELPVISITKF